MIILSVLTQPELEVDGSLVSTPVCVVSRADVLELSGWSQLKDVGTQGPPFRLYRDLNDTYLQVYYFSQLFRPYIQASRLLVPSNFIRSLGFTYTIFSQKTISN
jgi:hypothetical protein